jgi:hypothetical protein
MEAAKAQNWSVEPQEKKIINDLNDAPGKMTPKCTLTLNLQNI